MKQCRKASREFEFPIGKNLVVVGTVSGEIIPADENFGEEVKDLEIVASVFATEGGSVLDTPLDDYEMDPTTRAELEQYATDVLCEEEAA